MSAVRSSGSHLAEVAHRSSTSPARYNLRSGDIRAQGRASNRSMGGMVSAITAAFCGSNRSRHSTDMSGGNTTVIENGYHASNRGNKAYHSSDTARMPKSEDFTLLGNSRSCDSSYHTAAGSVSELANGIDLRTGDDSRQPLDIPYMDESVPSSSASTPRDRFTRDEEVIVISEGEYSADEDQGVLTDHSDMDEIERVSDEEEEADEHLCHSNCEHSEEDVEYESGEEVEYESEVESGDQLLSDSECDSEIETSEASEYDSDEGANADSDVDDEEAIEISEGEASWDDEQSEEDEQATCECDSDCGSDCDGNHHECSSECGCDEQGSDTEESKAPDTSIHDRESPEPVVNKASSHKPLPLPRTSLQRAFPLPNASRDLFNNTANTVPQATERNNNRLQRNHSQRLEKSNSDLLGELKTAIDARIRRSASCRETAIDYRKRFMELPTTDNGISENIGKPDIKERELRRKERRSRLRTLELKREQCLAEVRDGTEENVAHRVYS